MTGFLAATYLRGVPFVQVPTTLLAQVDSSVGGKVAINLPEGKNLVGNFYHPEMVIIDPDVLRTLESRVLKGGMAEVIKYGCIRDRSLFEKIKSLKHDDTFYNDIGDIIYRCCDIKREIVENDERDMGERMLLNFGHTLGHGIEKAHGYELYTHGEAVAIGMYQITLKAEGLGLTKQGVAQEIKHLLDQWRLETNMDDQSKKHIKTSMLTDKKRNGDWIHFILIKDIGEGYIYKESIESLENFIV